MDSTFGASPAGWDFYYTRYGIDACEVREQYTKTSYRLLPTTSVTSWIVPLTSDWHIRIHRIYNLQTIDIADGGFAIPVEDPFVSKVGLLDGKLIPGQEHIQECDMDGQPQEHHLHHTGGAQMPGQQITYRKILERKYGGRIWIQNGE